MPRARPLPLLYVTPDSWSEGATRSVYDLLVDHAHLERKAAANAVELLSRWPDKKPNSRWLKVLNAIARDEVEHFGIVVKMIEKRGKKLSRVHKSTYVQKLRRLVRVGHAPTEILDRLLVSALVEARSCERFEILSRKAEDTELKKLYKALWASEHGHYKIFLSLGKDILPAKEVNDRWQELLVAESEIIQSEKPGSGIHSAVG